MERSPGRTQNEKCLREPSRFGLEGPGTQVFILVSFLEEGGCWGAVTSPPCRRAEEWAGEEEEKFRTVGRQLAVFCEELGAMMVRSHRAPFSAPVLALLSTCCVTFGKSLLTLGLSFSICQREGGTRPVTFK